MTQQHPITPSQELIQQWRNEGYDLPGIIFSEYVATRAYQAGADQANADIERERQEAADQELEKCRQWLGVNGAPAELIDSLLDARRPKPKSEKQQALEQLDGIRAVFRMSHGGDLVCDAILRALKSIPDPS
jgi:hypothetical protein